MADLFLEKLRGMEAESGDIAECQPSESQSTDSPMFSDFDRSVLTAAPQHSSIEDEVNQYFASASNKGKAFVYWREFPFKRLAKLALVCLSVPAISAPV